MGTRGLTKVIYKNQVMVAQYGQWDHYLDGQGKTIQEFLKTMNRTEFLTNLELSNYITDKEVDTILEDRPKFDNYDDESAWYELVAAEFTRDTGAGILKLIQDAPRALINNSAFVKDSIFCEGVFELNFDNNTVQFKSPMHGKKTKVYSFTEFLGLNLENESKLFYDRE